MWDYNNGEIKGVKIFHLISIIVYFIVKCPKCGRLMMFRPNSNNYKKWKKKCFFCGTVFKIYPKRGRSRIVYATNDYFDALQKFEELARKSL